MCHGPISGHQHDLNGLRRIGLVTFVEVTALRQLGRDRLKRAALARLGRDPVQPLPNKGISAQVLTAWKRWAETASRRCLHLIATASCVKSESGCGTRGRLVRASN